MVIFDEPTRGIDVAAKVEIYNLMNQLKQQGIAVMFVSSEMPEVMGIADRIVVMCDGRITGEVMARETTQEEILTLGLHQGYTDPKDKAGKAAQYEVIRALADEFKRENGSIICRELLGLDENFKPKPPEERTEAYYKKRPCGELCQQAAEILEAYLNAHPETET